MQYIQLVYNPVAGQRIFHMNLDLFIEVFQKKGYEVHVHRTVNNQDFEKYLVQSDLKECAAVIVAGGDGSINRVINTMFKNNIDIPLGVIPAGTANDFAKHLGIPQDQQEAILMLANMNIGYVDVGKVNDDYFINVCCGGLFTNISQNIDLELKNTLGKLAYYIKGVQQLPNFKRFKFRIEHEKGVIEDYFYLFLLLNGSSAGGFAKLGQNADITDGVMDFVGIKACQLSDISRLFYKILMGEHLNDKDIVFFQSSHLKIENLEDIEGFEETDIDGEEGPEFPLDIHVLHKKLRVIQP